MVMRSSKALFVSIIGAVGSVLAAPYYVLFLLQSVVIGRDESCSSVSQFVARWPDPLGRYLRRSLHRRVIARVGREVDLSFGTVVVKSTAEIGDFVFTGKYCVLGDVRIGAYTMLADHVVIPSGSGQHGFSRLDVPMQLQPGRFKTVHIGDDCWVGSNTVVMADIGDHCIVGAGSTVTTPVSDYQIVAGNPARVVGDRRDRSGPGIDAATTGS